jgi:electron transfer flavoprotein alpha subunit
MAQGSDPGTPKRRERNVSETDSMKEILIWAEQQDGRPTDVALEILKKAGDLAALTKARISAAVLGNKCRECAADLIAHGAERVFLVEDPQLGLFQADVYTKILCGLIAEICPSVVLMGGTSVGTDLAPAVAARLGTGLTAHCTDLHVEAFEGRDQLVMVVPGWRGNMMVKIVCPEKRPVMATIRPGVMEKGRPDPLRTGEIIAVSPDIDEKDFRARTLERVQESEEGALEQANIIVSGGFGFYEAGGAALLEILARALGGVTAGSRPACDAGWIAETKMIGQSGRTVSPDLFISIGASGAPHYTTGFTKSKVVVAIDKNPKAPIFEIADFGFIGDLREIIPALVEELESER